MSKYTLAGIAFESKAAITRHYREVKAATGLHEVVTDPVINALYRHHPEWEQKSQGADALWIDLHRHQNYAPTQQIMLRRPGQASMDISVQEAINGLCGAVKDPKKELLNEFRRAARCEIDDQVREVRKPGMDVDHVAPLTFEVLLRDWLRISGLRVSDVPVESLHGQQSLHRFAETAHSEAWNAYHRHCAVLEAISKAEHAKRRPVKVDWSDLL